MKFKSKDYNEFSKDMELTERSGNSRVGKQNQKHALYDVRGFDCLSSDDNVGTDFKTDIGHICRTCMRIYIFVILTHVCIWHWIRLTARIPHFQQLKNQTIVFENAFEKAQIEFQIKDLIGEFATKFLKDSAHSEVFQLSSEAGNKIFIQCCSLPWRLGATLAPHNRHFVVPKTIRM